MENLICTGCTYLDFFMVFKLYNPGLRIMSLTSDLLLLLDYFLAVFFWAVCKLYKSGLYIITYFEQGQYFFEGFQYLVF